MAAVEAPSKPFSKDDRDRKLHLQHPHQHQNHQHQQPAQQQQQRPPLRSNFELEPNPFEQSFSSSRTAPSDVSSSSVATQASLKQNGNAPASPPSKPSAATNGTGETPKPMLPPLASIASPSDNSYAWGMSAADMGSLRSGPPSPAMLAGPQHQSAVTAPSPLSLGFDASAFPRTGLTPSTGLTPLVAGPVSFPPPSPNTAAFLAMVSNSTTAANLASSTAATITPNTLSAITGVLNSSVQQSYTYQPRPGPAPDAYSAQPASAQDNQQVNGLFLLSQAHQELAKREEAQRAHSASASASGSTDANSNSNNNANNSSTAASGGPRRAPKRKTTEPPAPAPVTPSTRNGNKKQRVTASKSKRSKRGDTSSEDEEDDDDDDLDPSLVAPSSNSKGPKKPETEEEKRRNFLERNRQAALKCRQRKKAWLAQLQAKVEFLSTENERLNAALLKSSEEINRLTALVNAQSVVSAGAGSVAATVVGGAARGFGY